MADLAIAPAHAAQTMPQRIAIMAAGWLKRLLAIRPVSRSAWPAASELARIASIDLYDIAPWLSSEPAAIGAAPFFVGDGPTFAINRLGCPDERACLISLGLISGA